MLPEGSKEAAQAALEAASAWTCSRCQASRSRQPNCAACTTVRFHRPNESETSRKSAYCSNRP